jgi:hypothetical protein
MVFWTASLPARSPEEHERWEFRHFRLFTAGIVGRDPMPIFQGLSEFRHFLHFGPGAVFYAV